MEKDQIIDNANKKIIAYLMDGSTDLISSENLGSLKEINVKCIDHHTINAVVFMVLNVCPFKVANSGDFIEFSVQGLCKEEIDYILNFLKDKNFILTNTNSIEEKQSIIKKYAPMAKINIL